MTMENFENSLQSGNAKIWVDGIEKKWTNPTGEAKEWWNTKIEENKKVIEKHPDSGTKRLYGYNIMLAEALQKNPTLLSKAERI